MVSYKADNTKTKDKHPTDNDFQYKNKFKSAVYVFVLFILLSNKVSYRILDIIVKVFSNSIDVIDENENPVFLGYFIMAFLMALIVFVF